MTSYTSPPDQQSTSNSQRILIGAAVALAYIAAAEIGFRVAFVAEQVTTVWAPTGIAIASLLIWGVRLWPAIWLGAFAVNAATNAPLWTAFVLATGNTLEAVLATHVLRLVPQFHFSFRRVTDVLAIAPQLQGAPEHGGEGLATYRGQAQHRHAVRDHQQHRGGERQRERAVERVLAAPPQLLVAARATRRRPWRQVRKPLQQVAVRAGEERDVGDGLVVHRQSTPRCENA